jgi:Fe-Mn family superoxide dismutase
MDALEPHYQAKALDIHYSKHHMAYMTKVNAALEKFPEYASRDINDLLKNLKSLPDAIRTSVRNAGGGFANHTFFWNCMKPAGGGRPQGDLARRIDGTFGSYEKFAEQFKAAAVGRFGSGWAWLVLDGGTLKITSTANADTPMASKQTALLTVDVWEHAYYLDYQNRRPDFVQAFLDHLVNWEFVAGNVAKAK